MMSDPRDTLRLITYYRSEHPMPDFPAHVTENRTLWAILDTDDLCAAVHRIITVLRDAGVGCGAPDPDHGDHPLDLSRLEVDLDYARWTLLQRGINTYHLW